jgi:hypothetical protein
MSDERECPRCGAEVSASELDNSSGICHDCKASEQRRIRAGLRLNTCGTCGSTVEGYDVCSRCRAAIRLLGGTVEALKQAVRAWRWLQE